ncbi:hypothetical protein BDQ94DRAFT_151220 [Aspergillus welwitschiae]|uniref:Uncharacterized protein n=1 Tax=Aspergillus welwitschiae TaxID=1341132 RepID=A0A3F3PQ14_9EURO|nr:hypothetical protein BDQ94DRAFT_151220 [Aspergillus welwitschiae]RDH29027.1 hypothetical protein BDQ94DRAFT_151220 [Aspergillus welwitschiae]
MQPGHSHPVDLLITTTAFPESNWGGSAGNRNSILREVTVHGRSSWLRPEPPGSKGLEYKRIT